MKPGTARPYGERAVPHVAFAALLVVVLWSCASSVLDAWRLLLTRSDHGKAGSSPGSSRTRIREPGQDAEKPPWAEYLGRALSQDQK